MRQRVLFSTDGDVSVHRFFLLIFYTKRILSPHGWQSSAMFIDMHAAYPIKRSAYPGLILHNRWNKIQLIIQWMSHLWLRRNYFPFELPVPEFRNWLDSALYRKQSLTTKLSTSPKRTYAYYVVRPVIVASEPIRWQRISSCFSVAGHPQQKPIYGRHGPQ